MKNIDVIQKYGELYENIESGNCETFTFKNYFGLIKHVFIKKEIPIKINDEVYYEIVTPFNYGGPLIIEYKEKYKDKLIKTFYHEFKQYCESKNIISESIHFHPIFLNATDFSEIYETIYLGKTLGINLNLYENPCEEGFSLECRNNIQLAFLQGVTYRVIEKPKNTESFKKDFLKISKGRLENEFLKKGFYTNCFDLPYENIIIVEVSYNRHVIGISANIFINNILQPLISSIDLNYEFLYPNYILLYALANWGESNKLSHIHLGGGNSIGEEDSLYEFKKQFGNSKFNFYFGKKIWNQEIYNKLCLAVGVGANAEYFPAYRINEI